MTPKRRVLIASCLVVLMFGGLMLGQRLHQREALRRYKSGLIARGEKLTYAELVPVLSRRDEAGYAKLIAAAAKLPRGGLLPSQASDLQFTDPGQVKPFWREESPWAVLPSSKSTNSWDQLAGVLAGSRDTLRFVREMLREPPATVGLPAGSLQSPPTPFIALRNASEWLLADTFNELREGDRAASLEDLEALVNLSRVYRDEYRLINQMIRVAFAGRALSATWQALAAPAWTDADLARLQNAWAEADLLPGLEKAFLGERAFGAELFSTAQRPAMARLSRSPGVISGNPLNFGNALHDFVLFPVYLATSVDRDELLRLQATHEAVLAIRSADSGVPWPQARQAVSQRLAYLENASGLASQLHYMLSAISVPNFSRALDRAITIEAQRRLTITALALERFRLKRAAYPPDLAALTPEYLRAVPVDPFSGAPLCYRLLPDGRFLLYSVGEDGRDNGGDATPKAGSSNGLWSGKDGVWPEATR